MPTCLHAVTCPIEINSNVDVEDAYLHIVHISCCPNLRVEQTNYFKKDSMSNYYPRISTFEPGVTSQCISEMGYNILIWIDHDPNTGHSGRRVAVLHTWKTSRVSRVHN